MTDVIRHRHEGYFEWEIIVYETGNRFKKWNARTRETRRIATSPLRHPPPVSRFFSEYMYGDPFGARTANGALKKALRSVRKSDARQAREERLWAAMQ